MSKWLDRHALRLPFLDLCTTQEMFDIFKTKNGIETINEFLPESSNAATHFYRNSSHQICCIVCVTIDDERDWFYTASLIAHEAMHVVQHMMRAIAEDNPGDEIEAYAIENCVYILLKEYDRQRRDRL